MILPDSERDSLILIVDDNVPSIEILSALLKDLGDIIVATSGADAIKLAEEHQPDLILLDQEMPGMDGYETCRALKANDETRHCAIIFVTAHAGEDLEVDAFAAGAVDFIAKPFNAPVVIARVNTHLVLKRNRDALQQLADRDGLTGVYNRRYLDTQLTTEIRRHHRQGQSLGFAMVDIDFFKAYNDGYGHLAGDDCLRRFAQRLSGMLRRPGELVARYGGEEFAIVIPHLSVDSAEGFAQWVCQGVRDMALPHAFSDIHSHLTASVGLAVGVPPNGMSARELTSFADAALYEAKSNGRNTTVVNRFDRQVNE
ncbi:diguanylate cyclase [Marinobacter sp. BGYM27]|uniref:diguanylate cyclase domain-containing protein n=1 Tax=Marinobacter sp. BGYM27 TaxID=2975597 RepID=UPI0021A64BD9|nr:diguanylate cyclase [Marinobacter sp. BGYM27]MDG5501370.1 diguanylate cyclase [Marinobacter sp. BGYM27]